MVLHPFKNGANPYTCRKGIDLSLSDAKHCDGLAANSGHASFETLKHTFINKKELKQEMLQLIKGYIRITIYKELFAFFFFLDYLFQAGENAEVTKGGLFKSVVDFLDSLLGSAVFLNLFTLVLGTFTFESVLIDAGVGNDDFLVLFREFDYLEIESFTLAGFGFVGFLEMTHGSETFNAIGESDGSTLVVDVGHGALMHGSDGEE